MSVIYKLLVCHMLGDYVLQTDFLASTKSDNWWHLLAHCMLYTVPFAMVFGVDQRIFWLFLSHLLIDVMKASWKVIEYVSDQMAHIIMMLVLYLM